MISYTCYEPLVRDPGFNQPVFLFPDLLKELLACGETRETLRCLGKVLVVV